MTLAPLISFGQNHSYNPGFTGQAFLIGMLILSGIFLVLGSLVLFAKADELRRSIKDSADENIVVKDREGLRQDIMNMEPSDIEAILNFRNSKRPISDHKS